MGGRRRRAQAGRAQDSEEKIVAAGTSCGPTIRLFPFISFLAITEWHRRSTPRFNTVMSASQPPIVRSGMDQGMDYVRQHFFTRNGDCRTQRTQFLDTPFAWNLSALRT